MKVDSPYLLFQSGKNILFWIFLPALFLLSIIYCAVVEVLKFLYKLKLLPSYRPQCKVISVGNITLGGTGKTPIVEWTAKFLKSQRKKPGIIIRGYKRPKPKKTNSGGGRSSYLKLGDEACMLKENLGDIRIGVGRNKIASAKELEGAGCNVLVLDDGFQHWRLRRDLDVVAIDCSRPFLQQMFLPLGRLREPLSSLKRAHVFLLTKTDMARDDFSQLKAELHKINPKATMVSSVYSPVCFHDLKTDDDFAVDTPSFRGMPVFILSGIANPMYFDKMLSGLKLNIRRELVYPDHYDYKRSDLEFIKSLARELKVGTVVTTHKDAVRLRRFLNYVDKIDIFYLKVELKITKGEKEFRDRILFV